MRRGQYAAEVITHFRDDVTLHTRRAFQAFFQTEEGEADFNPANTTLKTANSRPLPGNTAGVQEYASAKEGVKATIKTLEGKGHGYERIIRRIKRNASAYEICVAIIESDWGTGEAINEEKKYLLLEVLDDIKHGRQSLATLEAREVAA